ncbi:MAG: hypothetical protein HYU64_01475 [Armatimonadetes bacterium]|nr:hypothetical protein [Armatimonadota bacterium]
MTNSTICVNYCPSQYQAVLQNPKSSESDKSLAQMEINMGDDYMYNEDAAKARYKVMKQIAGYS